MTTKKVNSYCSNCEQYTNQNVLAEQVETHRGDYTCNQIYQIIECLGCDTKSFRNVFQDIEQAFQIPDGEWEVPTSITVYPKFIKNHRSLDGEDYLPSTVRQIYKEALLAFQEGAFILTGLGLRGTVEAVCKDLKIIGQNLEIKITQLAMAEYISRKEAERLHGIRFMGNDAAHETKKPEETQVLAALKIVEHLLSSVYIIEEETQDKIETLITEFVQFEELLNKKLKLLNIGDEIPIIGIFGRDIRRIKNSVVYQKVC